MLGLFKMVLLAAGATFLVLRVGCFLRLLVRACCLFVHEGERSGHPHAFGTEDTAGRRDADDGNSSDSQAVAAHRSSIP